MHAIAAYIISPCMHTDSVNKQEKNVSLQGKTINPHNLAVHILVSRETGLSSTYVGRVHRMLLYSGSPCFFIHIIHTVCTYSLLGAAKVYHCPHLLVTMLL